MRKWIFSLLFLLMVGGVPRGMTTSCANERELDMATYTKDTASLVIISGQNAPFCYTYPDTVTANLGKLEVLVYYTGYFDNPVTFSGYGTGSSTFPAGSTMTTSLTSFDTATNTATITVSVTIATFTDGGDTFNGFTSTLSLTNGVVYENHLVSIAIDGSSAHATTYNKGEYVEDFTGFIINATFTSGSYAFGDFVNKKTGSSNYGYDGHFYLQVFEGNRETAGSTTDTVRLSDGWTSEAEQAETTYSVTVTNICDSISISRQPNDVTYAHGDTIDMTGAIIRRWYQRSAIYGDLFEEDTITSNTQFATLGYAIVWRVDGSSATTAVYGKGDLLVTLTSTTYTGGSTYSSDNEVDLTITRSVSSIAVTDPTKTTYKVGEKLDMTGFALTATYSDGATETITSGYRLNTDFEHLMLLGEVGTKTITVTYGGKTDTFDLTITKLYSSFSITTQPTDVNYKHGDTLDMSGMVITFRCSTGEQESVSVTNTAWLASNGFALKWTVNGNAATTAIYNYGDLYLTYQHATYSDNNIYTSQNEIDITVVDELSSIAVKTPATKTSFDIGDTLDTSGLVITATYLSCATVDIQSGFTLTPNSGYTFKKSDIGSKTITITYQVNDIIKQTTYSVTVTGYVKSISITTAPTNSQYYGSYFDNTGMVVTKYWSDDLTSETTTDYTTNYDSVAFSALGTTLISVVYSGVDYVGAIPNTSMSVTVLKPTTLSTLALALDQKTYSVGDTLDLSDIECTLSWAVEHGTAYTEVIYGNNANLLVSVDSGAYGANPSTYTFGAVRTAVLNTELNLSFKYNGTSVVDDLDVTVNGYYAMVLVPLDSAKYFKQNSTFSYGTLQVYLKSTLGYVSLVSGDFSLSSPNMSSVGTKTVTVTWNDGNYTSNIVGTYDIIVYGDLLTLTVVDLNTNYTLGSLYSDNELTVTANYDGGYSVIVESYTTDPENGDALDTAGNITVTVTYVDTQTVSATYTIVVTLVSDGKLYYYDEVTKAETLFGYPQSSDDGLLFNFTQTLDESDGTCKMVVLNNIRKPLPKYTVCYQKDTDTWWVVKKDSSLFVNGNRTRSDYLGYQHTIELVESLNYLSRFVLPTRAFYQYRYTYKEILTELIKSARITCNISENKYIDLDQPNKFFSFDGLLLSTAVKQIANGLASVAKLRFSVSGGTLGTPYLYFLPKSGLSNVPVDISLMDTAFEQIDGNEKHATRIVSKISNAQSSELCVFPKNFGVPITDDTNAVLSYTNATIKLPSKISKLDYIQIMPYVEVSYTEDSLPMGVIYRSYFDRSANMKADIARAFYAVVPMSELYAEVISQLGAFNIPNVLNSNDSNLDNYTMVGTVGGNYRVGRMFIKPYEYYSLMNDTILRKNCMWWKQGGSEIGGFEWLTQGALNRYGIQFSNITIEQEYESKTYVFTIKFPDKGGITLHQLFRFRIGYYPAADITFTKDNSNIMQVSAIYNQNGKLVDSNASSKQVSVYAEDCVSENIMRRCEYLDYGDILKVGTLVDDNDTLCVIKQVSVDFYKGKYSAEYMLSENTASASDHITADSNIVVFATPQDNTVKRVQSYKDYVEFNLDNAENHNDTPYLLMSKVFANIGSEVKHGLTLDFQCLIKTEYLGKKLSKTFTTITEKYFSLASTEYDLDKSKLLYLDFNDNNIVGIQINDNYQIDMVNGYSFPQIPYSYVDSDGEFSAVTILFCENMDDGTYPIGQIMAEYPEVPSTFFEERLSGDLYTIIIDEQTYNKDGYEIPVFEYELQMGEANGFVFGSDFLKYFEVNSALTAHLVMITSDIYLSSDNAEAIFRKTASGNRVATTMSLTGENVLNVGMSGNATNLLGKNVGFYLYYDTVTGTFPYFLFGINNCSVSATTALTIHINNYRLYGI